MCANDITKVMQLYEKKIRDYFISFFHEKNICLSSHDATLIRRKDFSRLEGDDGGVD